MRLDRLEISKNGHGGIAGKADQLCQPSAFSVPVALFFALRFFFSLGFFGAFNLACGFLFGLFWGFFFFRVLFCLFLCFFFLYLLFFGHGRLLSVPLCLAMV